MKITMGGFHTLIALVMALSVNGMQADIPRGDPTLFGFNVRAGGRFDNVRKCVASPTGTRGGIAADISAIAAFPLSKRTAILVDLPVMRPVLFALAFDMLQFEPSVALGFSGKNTGRYGWVLGPALGVSLNYGPDYHSEWSGSGRTASFFSMGPIIGGFARLRVRGPGENLNIQIGLSPYVIPLFGIDDPQNHKGVVIGGLVDCIFHFGKGDQE